MKKTMGLNLLKNVHRFLDDEPVRLDRLPNRTSGLIIDPEFEQHLRGRQRQDAIDQDPDYYPGKELRFVWGSPEWVDDKIRTILRSCENGPDPHENEGSKAMLDYNIWASRTLRPQYQEEFGLPREDYENKPFHILTDMRLKTWFLLPANSDPDIKVERSDENIVTLPDRAEYSRPGPTLSLTVPIHGYVEEKLIEDAPVEIFTFVPSGPPQDLENIPSPFDD